MCLPKYLLQEFLNAFRERSIYTSCTITRLHADHNLVEINKSTIFMTNKEASLLFVAS